MRKSYLLVSGLIVVLFFYFNEVLAQKISYEESDKAEELFDQANSKIEEKKYKEATELLFQIVKQYSKYDNIKEVKFTLAASLLEIENYTSSLSMYEETLKSEPEKEWIPSIYYGIGYSKMKLGKFKEAIDSFNETLKNVDITNDIYAGTIVNMGECYFQLEEYDKSIKMYNDAKITASGIEREDALLYAIAWCYYKQKKYYSAEEIIRELKEKYPDREASKFSKELLILMYVENGQQDKVKNLIGEKTGNEIFYSVGDTLFKSSKFKEAIEFYKKVKPKDEVLKEVNEKIEKFKKKKDEVSRGPLITDPTFVEALEKEEKDLNNELNSLKNMEDIKAYQLYQIGFCLYNLNHIEDAIRNFEVIINDYPKDKLKKSALHSILSCYIKQGNINKLKETALKIIKEYPEDEASEDAKISYIETLFLGGYYNELIREYEMDTLPIPKGNFKEQALFRIARVYHITGYFSKAIKEYEKFILNYPPPGTFYEISFVYLAECYYSINNFEKAIEQYKKIYETNPNAEYIDSILYRLGFAYEKLNKFDEALKSFTLFKEKFPNHENLADCIFKIGDLYMGQKDYKNAVAIYQDFSKKYPNHELAPYSQLKISFCYYTNKDFINMEKQLEELLLKFQDPVIRTQATYWLGIALYSQQKYENAISKLREVIDSSAIPSAKRDSSLEFESQMMIADIFTTQNKNKEALEEYKSLANKLNDTKFMLQLIDRINQFVLESKEIEKVIEVLKILLEKPTINSSDKANIHGALGLAYSKKGDTSLAMLEFASAQKLNPKIVLSSWTYISMAEALFNKGKLEDAANMYLMVLTEFPNDKATVKAALGYSNVYIKQEDEGEAIANRVYNILKKYSNLEFAEVQFAIAKSSFILEKWQDAVISSEKVTQLGEGKILGKAMYYLGIASFNLGLYTKALTYFSKIAIVYKNNPELVEEAIFYQGMCLEKLGKIKEAKEKYKKLMIQSPNSKFGKKAKERLSSM